MKIDDVGNDDADDDVDEDVELWPALSSCPSGERERVIERGKGMIERGKGIEAVREERGKASRMTTPTAAARIEPIRQHR